MTGLLHHKIKEVRRNQSEIFRPGTFQPFLLVFRQVQDVADHPPSLMNRHYSFGSYLSFRGFTSVLVRWCFGNDEVLGYGPGLRRRKCIRVLSHFPDGEYSIDLLYL